MDIPRLFERLTQLADRDTAVVSTLRRSLSFEPGQYIPAFPIVEPLLQGATGSRRATMYLVAGLWSTSQRRTEGASVPLATALRTVSARRGSGEATSSTDLRFTALLDSDREELPYRLRQAVSLINAEQISIDWCSLLADLFAWDAESRFVQQQWASRYWQATEPSAAPNDQPISA